MTELRKGYFLRIGRHSGSHAAAQRFPVTQAGGDIEPPVLILGPIPLTFWLRQFLRSSSGEKAVTLP